MTAGRSGYDVFLVVGLVGAFLTAAYMTRCVYLTFFGEYRGHGHPHESEPRDHRPAHHPLGVLGPRRLSSPGRRGHSTSRSSRSGSSRGCRSRCSCTPASTTRRPRSRWRSRSSASASPRTSGSSARSSAPFKGLTQRNKLRTPGTRSSSTSTTSTRSTRTSSWRRSRAAIADASYWVNQNVIDAVVNGAGRGRQGRREVHLREARPEGRRRCGQRSGRDHRRERRPPALPPVRSGAAVRVVAVRGGGAPEPLPATRQHLIRGESFQWTGSTTGP